MYDSRGPAVSPGELSLLVTAEGGLKKDKQVRRTADTRRTNEIPTFVPALQDISTPKFKYEPGGGALLNLRGQKPFETIRAGRRNTYKVHATRIYKFFVGDRNFV
jgi:hypothetical protein